MKIATGEAKHAHFGSDAMAFRPVYCRRNCIHIVSFHGTFPCPLSFCVVELEITRFVPGRAVVTETGEIVFTKNGTLQGKLPISLNCVTFSRNFRYVSSTLSAPATGQLAGHFSGSDVEIWHMTHLLQSSSVSTASCSWV